MKMNCSQSKKYSTRIYLACVCNHFLVSYSNKIYCKLNLLILHKKGMILHEGVKLQLPHYKMMYQSVISRVTLHPNFQYHCI